jgi:multiple sugar transport system permease protein
MDAFKSFDIIYVITKGGPGHATETLIIRAFFETFKYHKQEVGAVIGVFLLIVTFVITKYALKALEERKVQ